MAECLICEGDFGVDETNEHRIVTVRTYKMDKGDRFGVCSSCRAKVEAHDVALAAHKSLEARVAGLEADAALGRAVRTMPPKWDLYKMTGPGWLAVPPTDGASKAYEGPTPEAALRAAGLMEEEKP